MVLLFQLKVSWLYLTVLELTVQLLFVLFFGLHLALAGDV